MQTQEEVPDLFQKRPFEVLVASSFCTSYVFILSVFDPKNCSHTIWQESSWFWKLLESLRQMLPHRLQYILEMESTGSKLHVCKIFSNCICIQCHLECTEFPLSCTSIDDSPQIKPLLHYCNYLNKQQFLHRIRNFWLVRVDTTFPEPMPMLLQHFVDLSSAMTVG